MKAKYVRSYDWWPVIIILLNRNVFVQSGEAHTLCLLLGVVSRAEINLCCFVVTRIGSRR